MSLFFSQKSRVQSRNPFVKSVFLCSSFQVFNVSPLIGPLLLCRPQVNCQSLRLDQSADNVQFRSKNYIYSIY